MRTTLIQKRLSLGFTQIQVAEKVGITQPALANYEAGRRTPNRKVASRLEYLFQTSERELFPDIFFDTYISECNNKVG